MSLGKMSPAGPFSWSWPPEMMTISSAICRIRSWWEMMSKVPFSLPRRLWNTSMRLVSSHKSMPASGSSNRESLVAASTVAISMRFISPPERGGVHLSIQVFPAAQAHLAQHFADAGGRQAVPGSQLQQAADGKALKPHRLAERRS